MPRETGEPWPKQPTPGLYWDLERLSRLEGEVSDRQLLAIRFERHWDESLRYNPDRQIRSIALLTLTYLGLKWAQADQALKEHLRGMDMELPDFN